MIDIAVPPLVSDETWAWHADYVVRVGELAATLEAARSKPNLSSGCAAVGERLSLAIQAYSEVGALWAKKAASTNLADTDYALDAMRLKWKEAYDRRDEAFAALEELRSGGGN